MTDHLDREAHAWHLRRARLALARAAATEAVRSLRSMRRAVADADALRPALPAGGRPAGLDAPLAAPYERAVRALAALTRAIDDAEDRHESGLGGWSAALRQRLRL